MGLPALLGSLAARPNRSVGRLLVTTLSMIAEFQGRTRTREGMTVAWAKGLYAAGSTGSSQAGKHLVELPRRRAHGQRAGGAVPVAPLHRLPGHPARRHYGLRRHMSNLIKMGTAASLRAASLPHG
jgi:hypothetical protein